MRFDGDDHADHEERKADCENREDASAVKMSEQVDFLGGVYGPSNCERRLAPTSRCIYGVQGALVK
jgi:hypothetical protein